MQHNDPYILLIWCGIEFHNKNEEIWKEGADNFFWLDFWMVFYCIPNQQIWLIKFVLDRLSRVRGPPQPEQWRHTRTGASRNATRWTFKTTRARVLWPSDPNEVDCKPLKEVPLGSIEMKRRCLFTAVSSGSPRYCEERYSFKNMSITWNFVVFEIQTVYVIMIKR